MNSNYMTLYRRGEMVPVDAAASPGGAPMPLAEAQPHVVRVRVVCHGRERRTNHLRRWRYRGVDELRRQQAESSPAGSTDVDGTY